MAGGESYRDFLKDINEEEKQFLDEAKQLYYKYDVVTDQEVDEFINKFNNTIQTLSGIQLLGDTDEGPIKTIIGKLAVIQTVYMNLKFGKKHLFT